MSARYTLINTPPEIPRLVGVTYKFIDGCLVKASIRMLLSTDYCYLKSEEC